MNVIRNGIERHDFNGKETPILKETAQARQRQRALAQLGHERPVIDSLIPVGVNILIEMIDECLGAG